ncbi:GNAT family N-acetyltransferase [Prevotella sp. 10(H)]|uniref:GNAT family N-acetyltransferase n=1 Tax=Prevotella sp. 10(H) TaxID=1158294 RepID=UPI0004A703A5|nr:GNAT family N-acetyltransferase [Prevotella sp. 10(H)]
MSAIENIRLENIHIGEFEDVAILLTDAFESNPAYSLIFEKSKLREGLLWLFKANLYLINRKKIVTTVIKEKDSGKIIGVYSLIPPGRTKNHFSDYLHIGLPRFIMKFGFRTLFKMTDMDSFNKEVLRKPLQSEVFYYLSMVVIKKEYRGKGIGSYVIKKCLDKLSKIEDNCYTVALTTQLTENVNFYSKLGFEKIGEEYLNYKGERYYNWNMKYNLLLKEPSRFS